MKDLWVLDWQKLLEVTLSSWKIMGWFFWNYYLTFYRLNQSKSIKKKKTNKLSNWSKWDNCSYKYFFGLLACTSISSSCPLLSHVTLLPLFILQPLSTTLEDGCSETQLTASRSVMWFTDAPNTHRTHYKHRGSSRVAVFEMCWYWERMW